MKHAFFLLVAVICSWVVSPLARADLDAGIEAVLRDTLLRKATVGIRILALDPDTRQSKVLYEHNPATPLIPASNMKVLTTSAALAGLGPDFKFRTLLLQRGQDLILVGDGDPTFGDAELLRKVGWDTTTVYKNWAEQLKKAGITEVQDLLVDDSVFDETFAHPHWPVEQLHNRFSAEVAGMTINVGAVDFFVQPGPRGQKVAYRTNPAAGSYLSIQNSCVSGGGSNIVLDRKRGTNTIILAGSASTGNVVPASVSVHDPALFALHALSQVLADTGIRVAGKVERDRTIRSTFADKDAASKYTLLAVHETPILQVISRANKDSVNVYAESLCKRLGFATAQESGSWSNGPAAVGEFLKKCGGDPAQFNLDDGCGLSHQDTVSATVMTQVLEYNFYSPNRDAFLSTLAVAGKDGTLEDRFKGNGASLRGRVFGKSGYVVGVSSLSGYVKGRDGRFYAFSILMNGVPKGTNGRAKELQENIIKALDGTVAR